MLSYNSKNKKVIFAIQVKKHLENACIFKIITLTKTKKNTSSSTAFQLRFKMINWL